jgi:hypothetical protein
MAERPSFSKTLRLTDSETEAAVMDAESGWHVVAGPVSMTEQLADIVRDLIRIPPMPPIRVVTVPSLVTRFYVERDRFSGGVNLSACARNAARREEAVKRDLTCYFDKEIGNVYCTPAAAAVIRTRFPELSHGAPNVRPYKLPAISFEDMSAPAPDLSWTAAQRSYAAIQRDTDRVITSLLLGTSWL